MTNADYRIRIKIGTEGTEIEAEGDKAFVQGIFEEFHAKGAAMLLRQPQAPSKKPNGAIRIDEPIRPHKEKEKISSKKIPARKPTYLVERDAIVDRVMKDSLPADPPYRVAIQKAEDLQYKCAYVLLLFREKYEEDGLSQSELADILTKRFSVHAKAETIGKKLKKWPTHIDTLVKGKVRLFQLTSGGIDDIRHSLNLDGGKIKTKPIEELIS
jgi:hypothetical protein